MIHTIIHDPYYYISRGWISVPRRWNRLLLHHHIYIMQCDMPLLPQWWYSQRFFSFQVNKIAGFGYVTSKVSLATSMIKNVPKAFKIPSEKAVFLQYVSHHLCSPPSPQSLDDYSLTPQFVVYVYLCRHIRIQTHSGYRRVTITGVSRYYLWPVSHVPLLTCSPYLWYLSVVFTCSFRWCSAVVTNCTSLSPPY